MKEQAEPCRIGAAKEPQIQSAQTKDGVSIAYWTLGQGMPLVRHPLRVSHLILWRFTRGPDLSPRNPLNRALVPMLETDWEVFTEALAHFQWGIAAGQDEARDLASRLPDAFSSARQAIDCALRCRVGGDAGLPLHLEGPSPWFAGDALVTTRVVDFLSEVLVKQDTAGDDSEPTMPDGLITILFTDMESSTALTRRLGDAVAQEVRRAHNHRPRRAPGKLRQRDNQDLFGTSVDLAARICDHAEAGEILASNVVRELAAGKGFLIEDRGEDALKGFDEPQRLFAVRT